VESALDEAVVGRRITDAKIRDARLLDGISARELERCLVGRRIRITARHGKHVIAKYGLRWDRLAALGPVSEIS